jgi:beta-alanine degradation protein BauB
VVSDERALGGVGTKVVFENDQVRVWVLQLGPGERSAVHRHDLDHLLIQIRGDRIAVEPEPDAQGPHLDYMEAPVIPGMVVHIPRGGIETAVNVGAEPYYEIIVELKETTAPRPPDEVGRGDEAESGVDPWKETTARADSAN